MAVLVGTSCPESNMMTSTSTMCAMHYEVRRYKIQLGKLDDFVAAWTAGVVPLREEYGFTFQGAWAVNETNEFIWVLAHTDTESFESADRRYYESSARKSLKPDPAQFIAEASKLSARPVLQKPARRDMCAR